MTDWQIERPIPIPRALVVNIDLKSRAMRHESGGRAAIFLQRPGASTRVRSWTPRGGPQHGFLITHAESVSIAEYLTIGDAARPRYRPTVHYAYHPSDDAVLSLHELAGRNWREPELKRVVKDELVDGRDELGVLLMGNRKGAYWFGSQLTLEEARRLCPHNSATTLQVAAGVLAGCVWAIRNPDRDVVEPDQLPYDEILSLARPYLGEMIGVYTDWTPLDDRGGCSASRSTGRSLAVRQFPRRLSGAPARHGGAGAAVTG